VAHDDLVPFGDEAGERAPAEDLEVVRVRTDGEDANVLSSLTGVRA
jgi:hypothetical protein